MFGLVHEFGTAGVTFVAVGGVTLASVYEWRKTIVAPILLHTAVNGVGLAFIAWSYVADAACARWASTARRMLRAARLRRWCPAPLRIEQGCSSATSSALWGRSCRRFGESDKGCSQQTGG